MLRQTWLANKANKKVALRMMPDRAAKTIDFEVVEGDAIDFDPTDMTMKRGTIVCPVCGNTPDRDYLKREGKAGRLGERMLAVVYTVEGKTGKRYRLATDADRAQFEQAREMLARVLEEDPDALPNEPLPPYGTLGFRVNNYGLTKWGDLFSARQAICMTTFVRGINAAYRKMLECEPDRSYAGAVASFLGMILDRLADYNSSLCIWNVLQGTVSPYVWTTGVADGMGFSRVKSLQRGCR